MCCIITKVCKTCGIMKPLTAYYRNKTYFDGYFSTCKVCRSAEQKKQYQKNSEIILERHRKYESAMKAKNPKFRQKYEKKWRDKNPMRTKLMAVRSQARRNGYLPCNATAEELQNSYTGVCAICGIPEMECHQKLHLDHNHETGNFRGWLCGTCNRLLGMAKDNKDLLLDAGMYLEHAETKEYLK
jgi:hypothetical protein